MENQSEWWLMVIERTEEYQDDDDAANGDEMGLDSGFGAKLLLHSPILW